MLIQHILTCHPSCLIRCGSCCISIFSVLSYISIIRCLTLILTLTLVLILILILLLTLSRILLLSFCLVLLRCLLWIFPWLIFQCLIICITRFGMCVFCFSASQLSVTRIAFFCMAMLFLTTDCLSLQRDCRENQRIDRTENNYTGQTQNHLSPPF